MRGPTRIHITLPAQNTRPALAGYRKTLKAIGPGSRRGAPPGAFRNPYVDGEMAIPFVICTARFSCCVWNTPFRAQVTAGREGFGAPDGVKSERDPGGVPETTPDGVLQ